MGPLGPHSSRRPHRAGDTGGLHAGTASCYPDNPAFPDVPARLPGFERAPRYLGRPVAREAVGALPDKDRMVGAVHHLQRDLRR